MCHLPACPAPHRSPGFMLIELLVVVGLPGVLAAIASPRHQNHRERIRQTRAIQDIVVLQALICDDRLDSARDPDSLDDSVRAHDGAYGGRAADDTR